MDCACLPLLPCPTPRRVLHMRDVFTLAIDAGPHQRSLDVDVDLEGIIFVVEVKIPIAGKYLGGDLLDLEMVFDHSKQRRALAAPLHDARGCGVRSI